MAHLLTERARAYYNHSRWISDCGRLYCGNAEKLTPGQIHFACSNCGWTAPVEWPPNPEAITAALAGRPVPQTRNWFPSGHDLAVRFGCPHGQSVADLEAETHEHEGGQ